MLRAELCDYSNAYRAADGTITVDKKGSRNINIDAYNKELILKPNTPFTSCISKVYNTLVDIGIRLRYCNTNV